MGYQEQFYFSLAHQSSYHLHIPKPFLCLPSYSALSLLPSGIFLFLSYFSCYPFTLNLLILCLSSDSLYSLISSLLSFCLFPYFTYLLTLPIFLLFLLSPSTNLLTLPKTFSYYSLNLPIIISAYHLCWHLNIFDQYTP